MFYQYFFGWCSYRNMFDVPSSSRERSLDPRYSACGALGYQFRAEEHGQTVIGLVFTRKPWTICTGNYGFLMIFTRCYHQRWWFYHIFPYIFHIFHGKLTCFTTGKSVSVTKIWVFHGFLHIFRHWNCSKRHGGLANLWPPAGRRRPGGMASWW